MPARSGWTNAAICSTGKRPTPLWRRFEVSGPDNPPRHFSASTQLGEAIAEPGDRRPLAEGCVYSAADAHLIRAAVAGFGTGGVAPAPVWSLPGAMIDARRAVGLTWGILGHLAGRISRQI